MRSVSRNIIVAYHIMETRIPNERPAGNSSRSDIIGDGTEDDVLLTIKSQ